MRKFWAEYRQMAREAPGLAWVIAMCVALIVVLVGVFAFSAPTQVRIGAGLVVAVSTVIVLIARRSR